MIERKAREQELGYAQVLALRQAESVPIWKQLEDEAARLAPLVGKRCPLGKALIYFERQIRTVTIFRKNSLFVGSIEAGKRYSVLLTMMLNCLLVGANPYEYLADVISKISSDWPSSRIRELLPRQWQATRKAAEEQARGETS